MRQHVREFVRAVLTVFVPGRGTTKIVEVGSRTADGQGELALKPVAQSVCGNAVEYLGVDMQAGSGVDVVADVEHPGGKLDAHMGRMEVLICCDTLEHVRRPWVAMKYLYDLVRPNGLAIVAVPFMFQIHKHPNDYYRFTPAGLEALLKTYFHDVVTFQDPPDSLIPHTTYAVARRGFPFTPDERETLTAASESWLTNEDAFVPRPTLPTTLLQFQTPEAQAEFLTRLKGLGVEAPPETLAARYARLCDTPSDINEHLPTLFDLAKQCATVVEFGTRGAVSTTALLAGLQGSGGSLTCYDIDPQAIGGMLRELGPVAGDVCMQGVVADTKKDVEFVNRDGWGIGIRCDMLFVDTLHTFQQLERELALHATDESVYDHEREESRWVPQVRKWIVLHDTVTFGQKGEDGSVPGLMNAVEMFTARGQWRVAKHYTNNNGLTVLERIQTEVAHEGHD